MVEPTTFRGWRRTLGNQRFMEFNQTFSFGTHSLTSRSSFVTLASNCGVRPARDFVAYDHASEAAMEMPRCQTDDSHETETHKRPSVQKPLSWLGINSVTTARNARSKVPGKRPPVWGRGRSHRERVSEVVRWFKTGWAKVGSRRWEVTLKLNGRVGPLDSVLDCKYMLKSLQTTLPPPYSRLVLPQTEGDDIGALNLL